MYSEPSVAAKIISVIQIALALTGIILLFTTELVIYTERASGYSWVYTYGIWYNENALTWLFTAAFAVLFVFTTISGLLWGWSSSAQTAPKYARWTIYLGITLLALTIAAGFVVASIVSAYQPQEWWFGTAAYALLIGGVLFIVIGFIERRITRSASAPPPPPPPPPP